MLRIRNEGLAWSSAGDEGVVLDLDASSYLGLNETASFLWKRLLDGSTEEALVAALLAEYDVESDVAHREVSGFLADLRRRGYLEES